LGTGGELERRNKKKPADGLMKSGDQQERAKE
jgi:hypothetical protein